MLANQVNATAAAALALYRECVALHDQAATLRSAARTLLEAAAADPPQPGLSIAPPICGAPPALPGAAEPRVAVATNEAGQSKQARRPEQVAPANQPAKRAPAKRLGGMSCTVTRDQEVANLLQW